MTHIKGVEVTIVLAEFPCVQEDIIRRPWEVYGPIITSALKRLWRNKLELQ